jgi:hypothetical protein
MANEISNITNLTGPGVDVPLMHELKARCSAMVHGSLLDDLPHTVRGRFRNRLAVLQQTCTEATRSDLEQVVSAVMMRYPSMRGVSQLEAQVMVRAYCDDLMGLPVWAINAAARDITKGAVSDLNPDFPPSAPRIRQLAQQHLERPAAEMRDLRKVLHARIEPPDDPAMRERIKIGWKSLQAELRGRTQPIIDKPEQPKQAPSVDRLMEHYATHGLGFKPKQSEAAE